MKSESNNTPARIVWLDWLRVAACLMVMTVHATEPFYIGGQGSRVLTLSDGVWVAIFDSMVRSCVPLFVIASSYLLFPLHTSTGDFFRRRISRLLVPFILWSLVYALKWGDPVNNLRGLLLNFNYVAGHLWFVYMLVGIYLLMPMLSPWAELVTKRELQCYLGIWAFTLLIPFIRQWASGGEILMISGPTGIPNPAAYPLWGEASWNGYGTFYYVSGFIGYLLLGLYFRRFVGELSWRRTLLIGVPLWLTGFTISCGGFLARLFATTTTFPFDAPMVYAVGWEVPLFYDTLGVALMAVGWILLFRKMNRPVPGLAAISRASYGMYLCHMFVLSAINYRLCLWLGTGTDGRLGLWTTPVEILLTAISTFAVTAALAVPLQRIPKVGKWIIG